MQSWKKSDRITLSIENSISSISDILSNCGNSNLEVIIYAKLEAMIMKYCPLKKLVNKDTVCHVCSNKKTYYLKDRNNSLYRLINDNTNHLTHIFYHKNYNLDSDITKLIDIGIKNYRIDFFDENRQVTKNIIRKYKSFLLDK